MERSPSLRTCLGFCLQFFAQLFTWFSIFVLNSSCARVVVNSAENDKLIASVSNLQGSTNFKLIVPSIIAKCASCHQHQAWYNFNAADYVTNSLIIPGTPSASKLYYRLSTVSQGPGPRNMPQGGAAAFTDDEITLLDNWITAYP